MEFTLSSGPCCWIATGGALESVDAQTLELVEQRAIRLPDGITVTQGELDDGGSILLWGPADVWIVRDGALQPICDSPIRHALAGHMTGEHQAEIIVATPSDGLIGSTSDGCRFTRLAPSASTLRAAVYTAGARVGLDEQGRMLEIASDGTIRPMGLRSTTLRQVAQAASDTLPLWMAPATDGFVIGMRAPPFVWLHTSRDGEETVANPLRSDSVRAIEIAISTGVVQVDDHYLQVIADLQSTARRLLLFDDEGELVQESRIEVPFGVLAVNAQTRTLLVLRRTDRLELVLYEYSWKDADPR